MTNDKIFLKKIGKNIYNYRKSIGMSQNRLAKLCNINRSYLSEIENGTRNTTIINILNISDNLQTSIENIIK